MTKYDIIIIGGGISGLYSAYKITKTSPSTKILILEKNPKKWLGGRMGTETFAGTSVVTGAGVGRKEKDPMLIKLLRELDVPYNEFPVAPHYSNTIQPACDVKKTFLLLKSKYRHETHQAKTFKEFATSVLGDIAYKHFIVCSGYTDYEKEGAYETLHNYGFDDNYDPWTGLSIPWKMLIDALISRIGASNIKSSHEVTKIATQNDGFMISTSKGNFECGKIILATTIDCLKKILPGASKKDSIYQQIRSQPFLRLYGKFSKESTTVMKEYVPQTTVVPGNLQKIIPMNPDGGVYMIAYSDNQGARALKTHKSDSVENRAYFCRLIEKALGIEKNTLSMLSMIDFYWEEGTHYYEPLRGPYKNRGEFISAAQHPMNNILVVGEMISTNQGWVKGAMESVDAGLTREFIHNTITNRT